MRQRGCRCVPAGVGHLVCGGSRPVAVPTTPGPVRPTIPQAPAGLILGVLGHGRS
jgi:hypothetical protein